MHIRKSRAKDKLSPMLREARRAGIATPAGEFGTCRVLVACTATDKPAAFLHAMLDGGVLKIVSVYAPDAATGEALLGEFIASNSHRVIEASDQALKACGAEPWFYTLFQFDAVTGTHRRDADRGADMLAQASRHLRPFEVVAEATDYDENDPGLVQLRDMKAAADLKIKDAYRKGNWREEDRWKAYRQDLIVQMGEKIKELRSKKGAMAGPHRLISVQELQALGEKVQAEQLTTGKEIEVEHRGTQRMVAEALRKTGVMPPEEEFYRSIRDEHKKENEKYYEFLWNMTSDLLGPDLNQQAPDIGDQSFDDWGLQVEQEHRPTYEAIKKYHEETGNMRAPEAVFEHIAQDHIDKYAPYNYYAALVVMEDELKKTENKTKESSMETYKVHITNYGQKLNGQYGVMGVMTANLTEAELESNRTLAKNSKDPYAFIKIEYLDDAGTVAKTEEISGQSTRGASMRTAYATDKDRLAAKASRLTAAYDFSGISPDLLADAMIKAYPGQGDVNNREWVEETAAAGTAGFAEGSLINVMKGKAPVEVMSKFPHIVFNTKNAPMWVTEVEPALNYAYAVAYLKENGRLPKGFDELDQDSFRGTLEDLIQRAVRTIREEQGQQDLFKETDPDMRARVGEEYEEHKKTLSDKAGATAPFDAEVRRKEAVELGRAKIAIGDDYLDDLAFDVFDSYVDLYTSEGKEYADDYLKEQRDAHIDIIDDGPDLAKWDAAVEAATKTFATHWMFGPGYLPQSFGNRLAAKIEALAVYNEQQQAAIDKVRSMIEAKGGTDVVVKDITEDESAFYDLISFSYNGYRLSISAGEMNPANIQSALNYIDKAIPIAESLAYEGVFHSSIYGMLRSEFGNDFKGKAQIYSWVTQIIQSKGIRIWSSRKSVADTDSRIDHISAPAQVDECLNPPANVHDLIQQQPTVTDFAKSPKVEAPTVAPVQEPDAIPALSQPVPKNPSERDEAEGEVRVQDQFNKDIPPAGARPMHDSSEDANDGTSHHGSKRGRCVVSEASAPEFDPLTPDPTVSVTGAGTQAFAADRKGIRASADLPAAPFMRGAEGTAAFAATRTLGAVAVDGTVKYKVGDTEYELDYNAKIYPSPGSAERNVNDEVEIEDTAPELAAEVMEEHWDEIENLVLDAAYAQYWDEKKGGSRKIAMQRENLPSPMKELVTDFDLVLQGDVTGDLFYLWTLNDPMAGIRATQVTPAAKSVVELNQFVKDHEDELIEALTAESEGHALRDFISKYSDNGLLVRRKKAAATLIYKVKDDSAETVYMMTSDEVRQKLGLNAAQIMDLLGTGVGQIFPTKRPYTVMRVAAAEGKSFHIKVPGLKGTLGQGPGYPWDSPAAQKLVDKAMADAGYGSRLKEAGPYGGDYWEKGGQGYRIHEQSDPSRDTLQMVPYGGKADDLLGPAASMASVRKTAMDVFAAERMPSLFLKLESAVIRKMKELPASAPVGVQMMEGLNKVQAEVQPKFNLTGTEAVKAIWEAMKGTFNRDMQPIPYLYRKYGNEAVDAIVGY